MLREHTRDALTCTCPLLSTTSPSAIPVDFIYQPSPAEVKRVRSVVQRKQQQKNNLPDFGHRGRAAVPNTGTPSRQRASYGIPDDLVATNKSNLQEVWGQSIGKHTIAPFCKMAPKNLDLRCVLLSDPGTFGAGGKTRLESSVKKVNPHFVFFIGCGTFGVNKTELGMYYKEYCPTCSVADVEYGTSNHGVEGGDNYVEGTLDTTYISSFAPGVRTINSNTNTSMATEEGEAQGIATVYAMDAIAAQQEDLPLVLSLSLGSLGYDSCDALCTQYAALGGLHTYKKCHDYIQTLRQVCLYASYDQQERINTAFKVMGLRGTTVLGASGDGGSHWSFGSFLNPRGNQLPLS